MIVKSYAGVDQKDYNCTRHFEGIQKSLVTEVRAMKAVFENLEAEVDQNELDLLSGEIERKNLLIRNENLIVECLSKDVFYTATDIKYSKSGNTIRELKEKISRLTEKNSDADPTLDLKALQRHQAGDMVTSTFGRIHALEARDRARAGDAGPQDGPADAGSSC
ncbi:hypothetical protein Tco_0802550 [Tanacetum coccineum]|uniref:Uncharacterized protein n=1 Tax=Tanacetum coccineum TaxID=301880 RepID=A0ABQ5A013_9ASTR